MRTSVRLLSVFVLLLGPIAMGQLTNSSHDLTTGSTGPQALNVIGAAGICLPCHTPHNPESGVTQADAPLWNHETTSGSFTPYTTVAGSSAGNVDGPSRLCLGCHDGVTAMDSYGGATGSTDMTDVGGLGVIIGEDLTDDHPVGVIYPSSGQYIAAATVTSTGGLRLYTVDSNLRVECQSCHDPHDTTNAPFLRKSNAASALCKTCHNK